MTLLSANDVRAMFIEGSLDEYLTPRTLIEHRVVIGWRITEGGGAQPVLIGEGGCDDAVERDAKGQVVRTHHFAALLLGSRLHDLNGKPIGNENEHVDAIRAKAKALLLNGRDADVPVALDART